MKTASRVLLSFLALAVGLAACGGSGAEGTPDGYVTPETTPVVPELPAFNPPEKNAIVGRVLSASGQGIEGVTVTADTGATATTNYDGFYFLENVAAKDRIVVTFTANGYLPATKTGAMFKDGRTMVNAILLARGVGKAVEGGPATFQHGTVAIDPSAVVDATGKAPTGAIQVRVTPIPTRGPKAPAAPGDYSATTAGGAAAQLETFAMSDYQLVDQTGAELKIDAGKTADIEMLLPADTNLAEGETVPAWHFDKATGKWTEEGTGTIVKYSQDPTRLAFKATVSHFSTWNCDKPLETTCVSGTIRLCDGTAAAGADLLGAGVTYDGSSQGFAAGDGTFCLPVKKGSTLTLSAAYGYGAGRLVGQATVVSGSNTSQCPGPCTNADILLPCSPKDSTLDCDDTFFAGCRSCVQGRVVDSDGTPKPAVLKASTGTTTFTVVTDAQGHYCAPAAQNALVTLTANATTGETGTVSFLPTKAGACPDCETAPDLKLGASTQTGAGTTLDFSKCGVDAGGLTIDQKVANGTDPRLNAIDSGWALLVDQSSGSDSKSWRLTLDFISSKSSDVNGSPAVSAHLDLQTAPTGAVTFDVVAGGDYSLRADAYSAAGGLTGLGSDTYELIGGSSTAVGSGTIHLDQGFANVGDKVTGTYDLTLVPGCAPRGASLRLRGSLSTEVSKAGLLPDFTGGIDSPAYRKWICGLYDIFLMSTTFSDFGGALQVLVDGALAASDSTVLDSAKYSWEQDQLDLRFYGKETTFSASVAHPVAGDNLAPTGSLMFSGSDCYYEVKSGKVTLPSFEGSESDRWLTGSFDVLFTPSSFSTGTCPDHQVSGQFGGPVCR